MFHLGWKTLFGGNLVEIWKYRLLKYAFDFEIPQKVLWSTLQCVKHEPIVVIPKKLTESFWNSTKIIVNSFICKQNLGSERL